MSILTTAPICRINECRKPARYRKTQLCHMHSERLRKYGSTDPRPPRVYVRRPRIDRFREKYAVNPETGCWEWQAGVSKQGYGSFMWEPKKKIPAHRAAWMLLRYTIPSEQSLDHLCRNRGCVNPDHLEPVTTRENLLRGNTLAATNAAKTHCINGHEYTPENTLRKGRKRACRECNRIYLANRRQRARTEASA